MIHSIFETKLGWCCIIGEKGRLLEVIPFLSTKEEIRSRIVSKYAHITDDDGSFEELIGAINRYLSGERVEFKFSLDLSVYTTFQRRVWEITGAIPYGDTRTYGQVSAELGKARSSRAVGRALAGNPLPIVIPCHRVVRSNGELGGYSAPGGIDVKAKLLRMEGHELVSKGRIFIFS